LIFEINRNHKKNVNSSKIQIQPYLQFKEYNSIDLKSYELFAIIIHYGSANTGHFITYLRPENDENWYKFDDKNVKKIKLNLRSNEILQNSYFLFYR